MTSSLSFDQILQNIRTKLPIQNPLHSFVHNNILLMFEKKKFHDALEEAGKLYRAKTYWPLAKYKQKFQEGKISERDIFLGIDHYLGTYKSQFEFTETLGLSPKEFLYRLMFADLAFNDDDTQPSITDKHLWDLCVDRVSGQSLELLRSPVKWRAKEYWEKYYNEATSATTHPFIISLISSYLDQGQSFWTNPFLNKGFWNFFTYDVNSVKGFSAEWVQILGNKIQDYKNQSPTEIIEKELTLMGVPRENWEEVILDILFDLKGWSGMVNKLEVEPWQATVKAPPIKLVDYIAALLLIERSLDIYHAKLHSVDLSMIYGSQDKVELRTFQLSLALYQITKSFKMDERWMQKIQVPEVLKIVEQIDSAERTHLIRVWHEAYEHHYYGEALHAFANHKRLQDNEDPEVQVFCCMDDREESLRRHIEEIAPEFRTYGVLGFFGLDMRFVSVKTQRHVALCPPVVSAKHVIMEVPKDSKEGQIFKKVNNLKGGSGLQLYYQSRTLIRGFISTLLFGLISLIPMFLQVFFPNQGRKLIKKFYHVLNPEPATDVLIEKGEDDYGYSKEEQAKIVETYIRMSGIKKFSPLVILLGHGSSSTNNPFKQAYGCGACGGNAAIPNSRTFGKMANNPEVRALIEKNGIAIPQETIFVSGFHDTCTDDIFFFDTEQFSSDKQKKLKEIRLKLQEAAKLNAFERCQKFSSPNAKMNPDSALKHVHERGEDLAQPRPEYGHNLNAMAVVAKRSLSKGLFLNRRSFLLDYDWELDETGDVLAGIVLGGIPVACNINMDYYFSCVDNDNFGCGSKLPLNLTSLLGVMTGAQSDLRIGLARQMVEIHEPIRNITLIEAPLERVKELIEKSPRLKNIVHQHWIRLVVKDPVAKGWFLFGETDFKQIEIEKGEIKHFKTSLELLSKAYGENDFAEIGV